MRQRMRQNMTSVISNDNELLASTLHPPVESEKIRSLDTDPKELVRFLAPTPAPLLGLKQHRILEPSSRVSAATTASRARLNSNEETFNGTRCNDRKGRCKTTALVLTPSELRKWEVRNCNFAREMELRSSDESVISTATTVITCHRRVMSSVRLFGERTFIDLIVLLNFGVVHSRSSHQVVPAPLTFAIFFIRTRRIRRTRSRRIQLQIYMNRLNYYVLSLKQI